MPFAGIGARLLRLAVLLLMSAQAWAAPGAANPYSYESARALFLSRQDLASEFSALLAWADDPSDPDRREASLRVLRDYAYPVGAALGDIDSGGWAQIFFSEELERKPADYQGIIRKFAELTAQTWTLGDPPRGDAALARLRSVVAGRLDEAFRRFARADQETLLIDESVELAFAYRQEAYKLADCQGDVSLLVYAKQIPGAVGRHITGPGKTPLDKGHHRFEALNPVIPPAPGRLPTAEAVLASDLPADEKERLLVELDNGKLVIEGRLNPIRPHEAKKMLTQVVAEEAAKGLPPRYGTPHRWTKAFVKLYKDRVENVPYTRFSKLLMALASGVSHRFLVTDQELPLLTYVLGRPDNSVTFDELFRKAYQLNRGDVYLTLLTMENILAEYWRTSDRENRAVTRKLAPITNNYQDRGDKFGAWYHLSGLMLYAYATDERTAAAVARTETLGSHAMSRGADETQEDWINEMGPVLGGALQDIVLKDRWKAFKPGGKDYADPKVYLDRSEDFRDRIRVAPSRDLSASLSPDGRLSVTSLGLDRRRCLVELIPDQGSGLDSSAIVSKERVDLLKGLPAAVHRFSSKTREVRGFLSRCEDGKDGVFVAVRQSSTGGAGR